MNDLKFAELLAYTMNPHFFPFLCWVFVKGTVSATSGAKHCRPLHSNWKHRLLWKPPEGAPHSLWRSGRASLWKLKRKQRPEDSQARVRTKEIKFQGESASRCPGLWTRIPVYAASLEREQRNGERCRGKQTLGLESALRSRLPSQDLF